MSIKNLHIISFQVPFPADYGGVIEVFYKLKALKEQGVNIILHCYKYKGRKQEKELEKYASKVLYYQRNTGIKSQLSVLPYIVKSRENEELVKDLLKDDYPILIEGLHCCNILKDKRFESRKIIVRTHNIEHHYYYHLARATKNIKNKIYYYIEAIKLFFFERNLKYADTIWAISTSDTTYFKKKFPNLKVKYIPCFFDETIPDFNTTNSNYILFNGDLSVESNVKTALFLIKKVMPKVNKNIKLIIAGRKPIKKLCNTIKNLDNVELMQDLSKEKMDNLVKNARINLLFTFQSTGVKLKLLNALLHCQGHCLANDIMIQGTNLYDICPTANTPKDIANQINHLFVLPFSKEDFQKRINTLISCGYIAKKTLF